MDNNNRRERLIDYLLRDGGYEGVEVPEDEAGQRVMLRSLVNVRAPRPMPEEYLKEEDAYLREELSRGTVTDYRELEPAAPGIYLWRGDITRLKCDAIVNAANPGMTGCYAPCHACVDNAIHTFAGTRLRLRCAELMRRQAHEEAAGGVKVTPAFNLPCHYVLHTVGPFVAGRVTERDRETLASCYRACLSAAGKNGIKSVAFCCISTGEYRFPNGEAAKIAVDTVKRYRGDTEVIFDCYKDEDYRLYRELLG